MIGPRVALALCAAALALCATPAASQASTKLLSVSKAGAGTGTVITSPAGIECGSTCTASFPEGTTLTLTGSPAPGSEAAKWSGCDSTSEGKCTVAMNGPRSVTATFDLNQRTLTVTRNGSGSGTVTSSPARISCGATCSASFGEGAVVTLTGSPASGSESPRWSGCDSVSGEDKCLVAMNAARQVTATFEPNQRTLTVARAGEAGPLSTVTSSPAGIECGSTCTASYDEGAAVTLTGLPGSHTKPATWAGCDSVVSGKCQVTMSSARAVTATFDLQPGYALYPVSVERTGTGQGTVTGSPGSIACGALCSGEFITGTVLTLTASPSAGSVFAHWSGGGCTGSGTCTTTVKAAKTIKALFTAVGNRTLSVTKAGTGAGTVNAKAFGIECGPACASQVPVGKRVTLSAKAASGSTFARWSGACAGTAKTCKVTMSEARAVTATFAATSSPPAPPPPAAKPLRCKKGFKKRRAHGKAVCKRVRHHHRHHHVRSLAP